MSMSSRHRVFTPTYEKTPSMEACDFSFEYCLDNISLGQGCLSRGFCINPRKEESADARGDEDTTSSDLKMKSPNHCLWLQLLRDHGHAVFQISSFMRENTTDREFENTLCAWKIISIEDRGVLHEKVCSGHHA